MHVLLSECDRTVAAPGGQNWSQCHKFINEAKILPAEQIHSAPLLSKDQGSPSQN